jgi:hypothetical protein
LSTELASGQRIFILTENMTMDQPLQSIENSAQQNTKTTFIENSAQQNPKTTFERRS